MVDYSQRTEEEGGREGDEKRVRLVFEKAISLIEEIVAG